METIRNVNDHEVGIMKNGEHCVVAKNLSWGDARSISKFLNIFGYSSYYTSYCNIC